VKSVFTKTVEPSLRLYDMNDGASGRIEEVKTIPGPPAGSSGVELRIHFHGMLEGHRKGRLIRVFDSSWFRPALPLEERLHPHDSRIFSVGPKYAVGRDKEE
jgi:hypothetical protein